MAATNAPKPSAAAADTAALERRGPMALARPDFLKEGDTRGTENIGTNDIRPPALRLAQSTTPETKRSEPAKYIEGLREGEMFNSLTREIYGEGPIQLIIVNQLGHRNVEFDPNDKNVVLDMNVPDGDARTQFTTEVRDGVEVRVKPRATLFYDYLVMVVLNGGTDDEQRTMMTLSLKSTQLKKAKDINTLLKGSKLPSFAFLFEVTAVPERKKAFSFYGWNFKHLGYVTESQYNEASALYDSMKGKEVHVERTEDTPEGAGEDAPF